MSKVTRRDFLKLGAAGTCGAALHRIFSPSAGMMAFAAPPVAGALGARPFLVVVNLSGGCSYNSAPVYNGTYRDRNPTVSYSEAQSLPLVPEQGLHPSLTAFKQIWDEGNLALLNLVGYDNPNRSHEESTNIWFQGMRNSSAAVTGGWGARLTCQLANTFGGISLSGQNLFVQGDCYPPRALGDLQNFGENSINLGYGAKSKYMRNVRDDIIAKSTFALSNNSNYVRSGMLGLSESLARIKTELDPITNPLPDGVTFGNGGFANQCRDAARILSAPGLGTSLVFMETGGFDTHSNERNSLPGLLSSVNAGLNGLIQVAKLKGRWQDLVIITMSEFCRTHENDSAGTDHGAAAPMFVMGGGVVGGIKSPTPTAAESAQGDYFRNYHIHFCEPFYQTVQAMGLNADLVFPEPFTRRYFNLFA